MKRLVLAGLAVASVSAWAAGAPDEDPRSRELLRYACASELARDEVTLFANGTLRLRQRAAEEDEEPRLRLYELSPDELDGYLARLAEVDLDEAESVRSGPGGEWVEQCDLALTLDGRPEHRFRFGRYDSIGLELSRLRGIARELVTLMESQIEGEGLPGDYQPEPGDLLLRNDGTRYELVGYTWDGAGLELRGLDQPIVLFIPAAALSMEFVALLERDDW